MPRPKPPSPKIADQAWLDILATDMLAEAVSVADPRMLSATGFAREDISILHQQTRCANLSWALGWSRRVGPGSVVGIVGGSFSGLMLAVALSLSHDAIVYIFEKEVGLLPRFRDRGHRHLSPLLNSRPLGHNFDPSVAAPEFRPPIFAWTKGRASDVAAQWLNEFDAYDRRLPIFTFRGCEVERGGVTASARGLRVKLSGSQAQHLQPVDVDLLIDATGFGEERNPLRVVDFSYWEAGHRLIYDHLATPATVLISGCGDSGVIEAFHYALKGFRHEDVEALWPYRGPDRYLDTGLERARLEHILKNGNLDDCDALPEVSWWLETWWNLENNDSDAWLDAEPHRRPIFQEIERVLGARLHKAFPARMGDPTWAQRRDFANALPLVDQLKVRKAVQPLAEDWISCGIEQLADGLSLPRMTELRRMVRRGMQVVLNGRTPTPYTRQLSPFNVWLMRLLLSLPNVNYRQGQISKVARRPEDRRHDVTFKDGATATFDRVVTRYGPGGGGRVAEGARGAIRSGDHLLDQSTYLSPDPQNPAKERYFWSARETIAYALDDLLGSPTPPPPSDLSKDLYVKRILLGPNGFPPHHTLHPDPQVRLSADLKQGRRPTFEIDALVRRALTR